MVSNDDSIFKNITKESVIKVSGVIRQRDKETFNDKIKTGQIEYVFIQSNKNIQDAKEIDMNNKIFIPMFFDSKSKKEKQKGVIKKYIYSNIALDEPTHIETDEEIKELKNIFAVRRINNYKKEYRRKT